MKELIDMYLTETDRVSRTSIILTILPK